MFSPLFATDVIDISGKFTASVEFATSVVFATVINNTGGNLLLVSFISGANLPPGVPENGGEP